MRFHEIDVFLVLQRRRGLDRIFQLAHQLLLVGFRDRAVLLHVLKLFLQGRDDQVVQFKVEIPKKISSKAEELLRELATEMGENVKAEKRGLFGRKKS